MFDAGKTRMIVLPYGEKNYDDMFSPFSYNTSVSRTDGRTDRQTDRIAISISLVIVLKKKKKRHVDGHTTEHNVLSGID